MTASGMHSWHERSGARFGALNDCELVLNYGDATAEYQALRNSAGLLDLSFRGRLCLTGNDRVRFLHGQVTNEVSKLKDGQGCYAALVNAKGKVESDLNIYRLPDEVLLDFEPGLASKLIARFDKFIIADDVQAVDVSSNYGLLSIQGPKAETALRASGLPIAVPSEWLSFSRIADPTFGEIYCVKISRGPVLGFDLFVPSAALEQIADNLRSPMQAIGGRLCGWEALDLARVEAGIPRFGQDMDESNLAPEAGIEQRAISYAKGCYIGQEVISRIRAYGQVAKALRGLRLEGQILPKHGDKILAADKEVGHITSVVHSPLLNANVALGYVRREHNAVGTELMVQSSDQRIPARIVPLPFAPE
jgi:folate-binding protein YgfZ